MRSVVRGTGMYVPPHVVDNHRLSRIMDTSDEWIQKRTGIVERRYAEPGKATSDMAVPAAEMALADAGLGKDEIDYVVFATMTPDHYFPACFLIFDSPDRSTQGKTVLQLGTKFAFIRIHGTYQDELLDVPPDYGIKRPHNIDSFWDCYAGEIVALARDVKNADGLANKLRYLYREPGWRPSV